MALGHYAKNYLGGGSGGGGNANILIVHATTDQPAEGEPTVTLDKTYAEIDAAINVGALVFVDLAGSLMLPFVSKDPATDDMPAALTFSMAFTPNGTTTVCFTLKLTSSDSVRLLQCSSGIGG